MSQFKLLLTATALVLFVLAPISVSAQTSKGFVVGTVNDPNGAAVVGASVKITNRDTGATRETVSQDDGTYRLDAVDPGVYTVEVAATGFSTAQVKNITVTAAQTADVPVLLALGVASETVDVTATTEVALQNTDGARVSTIDRREITELPVANLNPVNLVFTLPGIVDPGGLGGGFVQGTEFSANGLRPRANNQLIDGLDNNDNSINGQSYQPSVRDGYSEVTILGSNFSAEFGRAGGAVVNVITRSGTNEFHGSVYNINQNSIFSALTPFQKAIEGLTEVPKFNQNTFGFSLGGPIKENKLFFFGTFQGDWLRQGGVTSTVTTPTQAGFNLLRAQAPVGANPALDQYLNTVSTFLAPTANVPAVAFESADTNPDPNIDSRTFVPFGTATRQSSQPVNTYDYITRVDWTPTSRDSLSFRYLRNQQVFTNQFPTLAGGTQFPGFEVDVPSTNNNFYFNYTRNWSANTTNEFRFGFAKSDVLFGNRSAEALIGPTIAINTGGITGIGLPSTFPQGRNFKNYQFQDTITHTAGNHTLRLGTDILAQRGSQIVPFNNRGILSYNNGGGFTALGNFVQGFSGASGSAQIFFGNNEESSDVTNQAYFVNDAWRVRDNLTLNLGLRYEYFGVVSNNAPFPAFGGLFADPLVRVQQNSDKNNFAPRFSFAYTPGFSNWFLGERDRTVIRGGFAVNYDVFFNNILSNTIASFPNVQGATIIAPGGRGLGNFGIQTLPTTPVVNPFAGVTTVDPNLVNPMTYVWNLGIQRELPGKNILDLAYVGSRGTHLFINEQANPGVDSVRVNPGRGPITVRTNGGDSNYHSLQARLERGFSSGFQYRIAYTFSKAIDNTASEVFVSTGGSSVGSDPFNRGVDRSVASYDVPHRFVVTALFDSSNVFNEGWSGRILGGFTFGTIYRIQSGNVETPFIGGADLNGDLNAFNDRPSIGNPDAPRDSVAFTNEFNGTDSPTGFSDLFGNPINPLNSRFLVGFGLPNVAGRNSLRSPHVQQLDTSLSRSFKVPFTPWESDRFEFRVDFFNVLNHPSFQFDNFWATGDVFNSDFNQPRENEGTARSGRIQIRYSF